MVGNTKELNEGKVIKDKKMENEFLSMKKKGVKKGGSRMSTLSKSNVGFNFI